MSKPTAPQRALEYVPLDKLTPYGRNSRTHSEEQIEQIAASIREFSFTNPILIDENNGIIAGHGRLLAARKLGMANAPCIRLEGLTKAQRKALVIADNKIALNAGWDDDMLKLELADLKIDGFDLSLTGFSAEELDDLLNTGAGGDGAGGAGALAERFGVAPFSVLNAREGWWQERKASWVSLGIKSEIGRDGDLLGNGGGAKSKARYDKKSGKKPAEQSGTSIFDPVLCELAYRWFCPPKGTVLDPFAGGSVRGVVASKLGRKYVGVELREEQVKANRIQAKEICDAPLPTWHIGDSRAIEGHAKGVKADMIFSCPPYADLEVYSKDPLDLSTMPYPKFLQEYRKIIAATVAMLKDDRFACFVVGEVRQKSGAYYNFVGDTVRAFIDAGLSFYNEAILVTPVGSLPIRVGKQFVASRKLGKTHQNVLVFVKGDAKKAAEACGMPEFGEIEEGEE